MGLFRAINRKFEADLIFEISAQLRVAHGLVATFSRIPCHLGRGGFHSTISVDVSPGNRIAFHYCGGMGFSRLESLGVTEWQEAAWMMALKNEAALRISSFIGALRNASEVTSAESNSSKADSYYEVEDVDDEDIALGDEQVDELDFVEGSYEHLVEIMRDSGFLIFEPFVGENIGGDTPNRVICLQMVGENPPFLILAKVNQRLGWDGRWTTWWFEGNHLGHAKISDLDWSITISKTASEGEQLGKLFDLLGEFLADINGISKAEILGSQLFEELEKSDNRVEESLRPWVTYGDSQGVYGQVVDELQFKDFSGRNPEVFPFVDGVTAGPAIVFNIPYGLDRVIVVYKRNALTWAATAMIEIAPDQLMQKVIPWKLSHASNAGDIADEIAALSHRLSFGDLTESGF